jgi:hypothetical protein
VRKRAISILKVYHSAEANLGDVSVVEKEVGRGGYGEEDEGCPEEEDGA